MIVKDFREPMENLRERKILRDHDARHETFRVRAGEYEAVYGNMPVFCLAAPARHLPAARKANAAYARASFPAGSGGPWGSGLTSA
jgi:hypothetical protein